MGTFYFSGTYDETMTLLVEARDYLAAKELGDRHTADAEGRLLANREAMRITSRLTQVMAWLLLQRAVHEGEVGYDEALKPENRLDGHGVCLTQAEVALPPYLGRLLDRSYRLYARVDRLDKQIASRPPTRVKHRELRAVQS
jgi:regulator of CtrA degradation